jgi:hypothetical protein
MLAIPLALKVPVPSVVAPGPTPDRKVTVPVGMPPVPVTIADRVTGVPAIDGVRLLEIAVDVIAETSVSLMDADALAT